MLKLPMAAGRTDNITDDGVFRVVMLFKGLKMTFDNAEQIVDILLDNQQFQGEPCFVIATIAKTFDQFCLLKPERA